MAVFIVSCYNSSTKKTNIRWVESSTYSNLINTPNSGEVIVNILRLNEYNGVVDAGGTSCFPTIYILEETEYKKAFKANTVNQVSSNLNGGFLISSYKIPATFKTI